MNELQEITLTINYTVIGRGYSSYMSGSKKEDNPYNNITEENQFAQWNYGWLQAYYQDKEGVRCRRT